MTTQKGKGAKATKSVNDLEIKFDRMYEFELQPINGKQHEGLYIIPSEALVWDESQGKVRRIRLCDGETSPYVDEQSEWAKKTRTLVTFKRGKYSTSGSKENVVRYLLAYDGNVDKSRTNPNNKALTFKYKLKDHEELFRKSASDIKLELKAKQLLADAESTDLKEFLVSYFHYVPKTETEEELFAIAMSKAEDNPQFVLENFKTETQKTKFKIIEGFKNEILINTKGVVTWAETGLEVGKFGDDQHKMSDDMTTWVIKGTKDAKEFFTKLSDALAKV